MQVRAAQFNVIKPVLIGPQHKIESVAKVNNVDLEDYQVINVEHSPAIPTTLDAAALSQMVDRGQITNAIVDGPLAFDNAISLFAAEAKCISSSVSGNADILVVPDLESGNMLCKAAKIFGSKRLWRVSFLEPVCLLF